MSNYCKVDIDERISFIETSEEPLSSEVILIKGDKHSIFYDVGMSDNALRFINENEYDPIIVISHFHKDHIGNLNRTLFEYSLYGGKKTTDYIGYGNTVLEDFVIDDGIRIEIITMESSHAKGSLALKVNEHLFISDSIYPMNKNDKLLYNTNDLKMMITKFKALDFKYAYIGHRVEKRLRKEVLIKYLELKYSKRNPHESYLEVSENELI